MKRILLSLILLVATLSSMAQVQNRGDFQIGAFGGASFPMGTYKSIGEAKTGYYGGMFIDKYFGKGTFGLGIDGRYLQHQIQQADSFFFANGHIGTDYLNSPSFKHWAVTLGPTYQFKRGRFQLEGFIRGGVLFQNFPQYQTTLSYADMSGGITDVVLKQTINDSTNRANAWLGLGGLRFNYKLTSNFAVFGQVDYMQSFGKTFANKPAQFQVEERVSTGTPIDEKQRLQGFYEHYEDGFTPKSTPYQSLNAGVGIKYIFGNHKKQKPLETVSEPVQQSVPKAIQVVVRDKQTGLALSGVKVSIISPTTDATSLTNAEGQAERLDKAAAAEYTIVGEKNGIKTEPLIIQASDFLTNETTLYRELLHDDPRFTLIGETIACESQQSLAHIATVLTRVDDRTNLQQTSDVEGKFIYQLEQNNNYTVVANQAGRYSQTELVSTEGLDRSKTLYVTLKLGVCDLVEGDNWVLKNIHYDFDKSNIRPDAALILENVVSIMKQNPSLHIELSSHTDSRGDDQYNMGLSQRRADSAVAFLVSHGIARDRLVAAGYGESRLLNACGNGVSCSEEQHQENRRTEIKVLSFQ